MISRRTLTTSGFAALVTLQTARRIGIAANQSEAVLEFSGPVAHQNLPELPTAPDGEVAVVMQSLGDGEFVSAIYQNGTDAPVTVTNVTATAVNAHGNEVDRTSFGPVSLEPGQYGFAVFEFDDKLPDDTEVEVTLSQEDDEDIVDIHVTNVSILEVDTGINVTITVENPHDFDVDDVVIAGVFFTPEGEILSGIATGARLGIDAGDDWDQTFGSDELVASDSFVVAASGARA